MPKREHTILQSPLPSGYRQLEYIEGNGTQYINTGYVVPSNYSSFQFIFEYSKVTLGYYHLFGACTANDSNWFNSYCHNVGGNAYKGVCYIGSSRDIVALPSNNDIHIVDFTINSNHSCLLKDNNTTFTRYQYNGTIVNNSNVYLFCSSKGNVPFNGITKASIRIYSTKIYENGTLQRYFLPTLRISDNKPGLYDLVNNQFYTNQGTGEFLYA